MASFTERFPRACHVLPLHVWREIVEADALLAKPAVQRARPTTSRVDEVLGFREFVHLYLSRASHTYQDLPILGAQLGPSPDPPFPHVVLEIDTSSLRDDECTICNWNLAVSRPGIPGIVKGGNWTRGTNPDRIREVWDGFRDDEPDPRRARGFFHSEFAVPVLRGGQISDNLSLLNRAPRGIPELLLERSVPLKRFARLVAFSAADAELIARVGGDPAVELETFPGYSGTEVPAKLRERLSAHLLDGKDPGPWRFDAIRVTS